MTQSPPSPEDARNETIMQACLRAREHLALVVEIVVSAASRQDAKAALVRQLEVSDLGAEAILDQQISSFIPGLLESRQ